MPIPGFQSNLRPLLEFVADGQPCSNENLLVGLAKHFNLTEEELAHRLPSGRQTTFGNRVAWAKSYLSRAGVVDTSTRGMTRITQRGIELLKTDGAISVTDLNRFPEFRFSRHKDTDSENTSEDPQTPEETIEKAT